MKLLPSVVSALVVASLFVGIFVSLFVSSVSADVISPPPDDCLEGSQGIECLGPPTCEPKLCVNDGDCGASERCAQRDQCIEPHNCGGLGSEVMLDHVLTECTAMSVCPGAAQCRRQSVCVADTGSIDAGTTSGGDDDGCSATPGRPAAPLLWSSLLMVAALCLRRRR